MPQQTFVLSYLIHPSSYREVGGIAIPLSFSITDREGYVLSYSPFALWSALKMGGSLAERIKEQISTVEIPILLGDYEKKEAHYTYHSYLGDIDYQKEGLLGNHILSEWDSSHEASIHVLRDYILQARTYGEASTLSLASLTKTFLDAAYHELKDSVSERAMHDAANEQPIIGDQVIKLKDSALSFIEVSAREKVKQVADRFDDPIVSSKVKAQHDIVFEKVRLFDKRYKPSGTIRDNLVYANRNKRKETTVTHPILGSRSIKLASDKLYERPLGEMESRTGMILKQIIGMEREKYNAREVRRLFFGKNEGRNVTLIHKVTKAVKENRGLDIIKRVIFSTIDGKGASFLKRIVNTVKDGGSSYYKEPLALSTKGGRDAAYNARVIFSLFAPKDFLGESHELIQTEKLQRNTHLLDDRILAMYHSPEAIIQKALLIMEKAEVYSQFLKAIMAQGKGTKESVIEKIRSSVNKDYHDFEWVEKTIYAVASNRQAFIDRLINLGDDISRDTVMNLLKEADIPDKEGLVREMYEAWNKDKENRPAGLMNTRPLATWDIGFDDLLDTWDDGWDYLDPPNSDYNYEKHKAEIYDENGIPLDPLGPINLADVDVKMPVNHPLPEFASIGVKEAWVDLFTFQDTLITMASIWKKNMPRLAEMSGHQGLKDTLKNLHDYLQESTEWGDDYQRMFRYVRWYAERIAHQDSITVLHRTYDDWRDRITSNGGVFTHTHKANQFAVQPTGTIESISTVGSLEFELENYIDGAITFSSVISTVNPDSTSVIRFYIDEELIETFPAGVVSRKPFDVPMGKHTYRWEYEVEVGDVAKLSGLQVSGVHFIEATTTQKDAGSLRGIAAVNHLIQALLTYYRAHHKGKSKGANNVYQRKIWLS